MFVVWLIVLFASLYTISKAADKFTNITEKIGILFKMPDFVVGVLVVALGTSIPELVTSIFGVIRGEYGVLSGNVGGSVIANIFLGLGLVVVISKKTAKFNWDSVSNDMPFLAGATVLLILTTVDGVFKFYEAILFLFAYAIYVIYTLKIHKMNRKEIREDLKREIKSQQKEDINKEIIKKDKKDKKINILKLIIGFVVSLFFIFIGAKYTIDSLIEIAKILGLGTSVLSASFVAVGTSLPEISVGIAAAKKGNFDLVIGNIMGSNVFNILMVFGAIGVFTNIFVPHEVVYFILPMMVVAILIQWLVTMDKRITVTEGLMMTLLYITFIAKLFNFF